MDTLKADVLVVGGGTGGTAAAIQAARSGAQTILVSEHGWLGGMLTSAGVCAPDGNELLAFQTGIWGAFLRELQRRQPGGLDHAWVSFFTYEPAIGAAIFADWVHQLPNLQWICDRHPLEVYQQGNRITGVRFADFSVEATITLDATELGDLLAIAEIPHRWGWEWHREGQEPSAPAEPNSMTQQYPVQAPTWVVVLRDFGEAAIAPPIPATPLETFEPFLGAWEGYGSESFMNYGRLPGDRFMINWPQHGNDYGKQLDRLIQSPSAQQEFLQEARWHSQSFARFIQTQLGARYGLATDTFPSPSNGLGGGAFALHPYYRESRRLQGMATVREQDILPIPEGQAAALPTDASGTVTAIALGNYANDHHYPGYDFRLAPKSIRWGGRWTGTPFSLPYGCLVPATVEGLLVCEKNISVSHIANGATRLQPVVLGLGQAAGLAAALCVKQGCQPQTLPVRMLQEALINDPDAPAAVIPLFNVPPTHPDWTFWQRYYLEHPEAYPPTGAQPDTKAWDEGRSPQTAQPFSGKLQVKGSQNYQLLLQSPDAFKDEPYALVTLCAKVNQQLESLLDGQKLWVLGQLNAAGKWILVQSIAG